MGKVVIKEAESSGFIGVDEETGINEPIPVGGEIWHVISEEEERVLRVACNQDVLNCRARYLIKCLARYEGDSDDPSLRLSSLGPYCGKHPTQEKYQDFRLATSKYGNN